MKPLLKNKTLLIVGAPGTGKGSYSKLLSKRFGFPVYSTGDHLRSLIKEPAEVNNKRLIDEIESQFKIQNLPNHLDQILSKGGLIDKAIMDKLIQFTLSEIKKTESNSIMFDGYPRTIDQAKEFDNLFKRNIDLVLDICQDFDIIRKKLLGRRNCVSCTAGYNVADINEKGYVMPSIKPKVEGVCDICKSKLVERSDDTAEVINDRLNTYTQKSKDILEFYRAKGVLETIEMKRGYDDIGLLYDIVERRLISVKH